MRENELLTVAHELALAVAPELRQAPLYVLAASASASFRGKCYGWAPTGHQFDPLTRAVLGERYVGPGNVFVLDLAHIEEDADNLELAALSIATHEVAHIVPARRILEPEHGTPFVLATSAAIMASALRDPMPFECGHDPSHDLAFIRRCVHLTFRAERLGYRVSLCDVVGCVIPHTCPDAYAEILAGETEAMVSATFHAIEHTPMPAAFVAQWEEDTDFVRGVGKGRTYA